MINNVVLVGRLSNDPTLRKTNSNVSVTSFTIACNRIGAKDGQQSADFINCVCWNATADNVARYTRKGDMIGAKGSIQTRSYDDNGRRVYVTEVLVQNVYFLEKKKQQEQQPQQPQQVNYQQSPQPQQVRVGELKTSLSFDDLNTFDPQTDIDPSQLPF